MQYFLKRIIFDNLDETLTGLVDGKKASDLEERWARAVEKLPDWSYSFRERISPLTHRVSGLARNLPGELEIDFLMQRGNTIQPILLDGEIGHFYQAWQRNVDELKAQAIDQALQAYHAKPVIRVPQNKNELWRLASQESADLYAREILA